MRKLILTMGFVLLSISLGFSQIKYTEIKAGLLKPADAQAGFLGGLQLGRAVDESVGIGLEFGVYHKNFNKEEKVDSSVAAGLPTTTIIRTFEQNTWLFPIFFNIQYLGQITKGLHMKVSAGLGYEFLWANYRDFENRRDKTYFFSGFAWNVGAGVSMPIGRASDLFAEVIYHGGKPSKSEKDINGFPARTEVNMNGLGARIGVRLYNFGF